MGLVLGGCRPEPPVAFPTFAPAVEPYAPVAGSGNAFDGYVLAGRLAVENAPQESRRVSFGPQQRQRLVARLGPALAALERASRLECRYEYRPRQGTTPEEWEVGVRLLGRAVAWRVERAVAEGDWAPAVGWTLVAHKVGFDLLDGDAASASLGAAFLDDTRAALAPSLAALPAPQAQRLYAGLAVRLRRVGTAEGALRNEGQTMLVGVQTVADAYRTKRLDSLRDTLGRDVRPAVSYLAGLSPSAALEFLTGLRDEALAKTAFDQEAARLPARDRRQFVPPDEERPWKRFARHYFTGSTVLLHIHDRAIARTRLFAVGAWARTAVAKAGVAPKGLGPLPPTVRLDPYNGLDLAYTASGPEFRAYSVGADGRDDGGDSDESGLTPDTVLEGTL